MYYGIRKNGTKKLVTMLEIARLETAQKKKREGY